MAENFFQESKDQSRIKAGIVSKYFFAWANVIKGAVKKKGSQIGYVDFFAGPGRYEDGTLSTPILILQKIISDSDLRDLFVCVFNDQDAVHVETLKKTIGSISGIELLKNPPIVLCSEIEEDTAQAFESMRTIPALFFIDPWGYKGLSRDLITAVIKDWACEAIFFFNYNRINMGITNDIIRPHMDALFGHERVEKLRSALPILDPYQREAVIMENLCEALLENRKAGYVLPFRFLEDSSTRTSHHLIFVTKEFLGYSIMKEVMSSASSKSEQGVSNFSFVPASPQQEFLFGFNRPLDDLEEDLLKRFSGQTLDVNLIYEKHSVGTPFLKKHYKLILRKLFDEGRISTHRMSGAKITRGFPDDILVGFPERTD